MRKSIERLARLESERETHKKGKGENVLKAEQLRIQERERGRYRGRGRQGGREEYC
jgi:hypothetical protein